MKVLALGGSGGMGRFSSFAISNYPNITKVTIADLNENNAKEFSNLFDDRFTGIGLDVTDKEHLEKIMSDHDIVLNTTGPFFKFGLSILKSAIKCKCHYFDICDDWEPTEEMLKLNDEALKNEITAIVGLGASPGISNLLGLKAMNELDKTESIITGWDVSSAKPEDESSQKGTNAAMEHGLQQISGEIKVYKDKKYKLTKPLEKIKIHYPGRGNHNVFIFGHPEALTFPYNYPHLHESINLAHGGDIDSWLLKGILGLVNRGLVSRARAAALLTWFEGQRVLDVEEANADSLPAMYGVAIGAKDAEPASVGAAWIGEAADRGTETGLSMGAATGIPLACGAQFLLDGRIEQKGVFTPEAGHIDPLEFLTEVFSQYEASGKLASGALEDNVRISRSW